MYRALLVCNSSYVADARLKDLRGPRVDATHLFSALTESEFGLFQPSNIDLVPERLAHEILQHSETFFSQADFDDVLLFYYSGHGWKKTDLYLCSRETNVDRLLSTAVPSSLLDQIISASRARTKILILDCCYSGAYKGSISTLVVEAFDGAGRYVLAATGPTTLAKDSEHDGAPSPFTGALAEGLRAGAVDSNGDGYVDIDDLFSYLDRVLPPGEPTRNYKGGGGVRIAKRRPLGQPTEVEPGAGISPVTTASLDLDDRATLLDKATSRVTFNDARVAAFRREMRADALSQHPAELSVLEFLRLANLMKDTAITIAGALLFSDNPTAVLPAATVQCVRYHGRDKTVQRVERQEVKGPIPAQISGALDFVVSHTRRGETLIPGRASAQELFQFPMIAVREIVANAVVHRDYDHQESCVHVRVFDDRIEVVSPGTWTGGKLKSGQRRALGRLASESRRRNFRLASVLTWIRMFEGEGSGIPKTLEDCKVFDAQEPTVVQVDGLVTVTIYPYKRLPSATLSTAVPGEEAFDDVRRKYQVALRQRYKYVDMDVLEQTADYPPAPLMDVFVELDIKADPPAIELPRELLLSLADGLPTERELPFGMDPDMLSLIRAYDQVPRVPVLSLIAGDEAKRMVLLGDPGAGKSTLGRYVAYSLAQDPDQVTGPLAPLAGWLPIFIELRDFVQSGNETFLDFLDHRYRVDELGLPMGALEPFLREDGQALVIFDGLDEIFDLALRQRTVFKIVRFATNYPNVRVMVTSRPSDFRRSALESAGFRRHKLQDHGGEKIKTFIRTWYRIAYPDDPIRAARLTDRLTTAIDTSGPVRELAGNPLLLTILTIIGRRQRLPRDRKTVYEHAVQVLVDQWDPSRFLHDRGEGEVPYLDAADKLEILRLIARRIYDSPAGLSGNFISGMDLISEIANYLQHRDPTGITPDQARAAANVMLRQFRERNFVLSRFGSNVYGFVHRSILEFLAAADIVHRFTSDRTMSETELVEIFGVRWRAPAWHEVLILVCGLLDHRFAETVILELFNADPHWMASDTTEPHQIFLAIRCLAESRYIDRQAKACRIAVDNLIHVLMVAHKRTTRSYSADLNRAVEQTLLPIFESFGPHWPGREAYLAWYMGSGPAAVDDPGTMAIATKLALALVGQENELFAFLCDSVTSGRPALRQAAVWAIANSWHDNPAGVELVRQAARSDPNREVRETAMKAAVAARPDDPETLALLRRAAKHDLHEDLRHAAVEAIARGWSADPASANLLRTLAVDDPHIDVRQAAIKGLAAMGSMDRASADLLNHLATDADHDDVRLTALSVLLPVPSKVLKRLAENEASEDIRRLIVTSVAESQPRDPQTLSWLKDFAGTDRAPEVRQTAIQAIAAHWDDDESARGFLLDRLTADDNGAVRESVVKAMSAGILAAAETWQRLQRCAESDQDVGVRQAAMHAIAVYRRQDAATLPWLRIRANDDREPLVRQAAIREIAQGWPDVPDIPVWLKRQAANDNASSVRRIAVQMVATIGADNPETRQWLEEIAVADASPEVRETALRVMADGWPTHPKNLKRLSDRVRADPDSRVRHTALQTIVSHWRDEPGVWPLLRDIATRDHSELLRRSAVRTLTDGWPAKETMSVLLTCLDDGHPTVRRTALQALSSGWPEDRQILNLLQTRIQADPNEFVRLTAVQEIARHWHHEPDTTTLLYDRARQDNHHAVRLVILHTVVNGWNREPEALHLIRDLAENDPHPAIRGEALQFLAEYWPSEERTGALLHDRAENDLDEMVRTMASHAVFTQQAKLRAS